MIVTSVPDTFRAKLKLSLQERRKHLCLVFLFKLVEGRDLRIVFSFESNLESNRTYHSKSNRITKLRRSLVEGSVNFQGPCHQQHPWFSGYQQQQMFSGTSIKEQTLGVTKYTDKHSFFLRTIIDWNRLKDDYSGCSAEWSVPGTLSEQSVLLVAGIRALSHPLR